MKKQKLSGPTLTRAAIAEAVVNDAQTRRIRLSFASEEAKVLRASMFDEPWIEQLGLGPGEVDLSKLNSGTSPLLWGHDQHSRENNIGVVEKAWVENGKAYADVRLSMRDDVAGIMQDVNDGIISNVSVGYQIYERTITQKNDGSPDEYRVTGWLPLEISLVSIPADSSVGVGRSAEAPTMFSVTDLPTNHEVRKMENEVITPETPVAANPQQDVNTNQPVDNTRALNAGIAAERKRVSEITELCARSNMDAEFARELISGGVAVDAARAKVLDKLVSKDTTFPHVQGGADEAQKAVRGMEDWLLYRSNEAGENKKPINISGNEYRGSSLTEIAKRCLEMRGVNTRGLTSMEIATRAITHSTSDFPIALQNVMNKTLLNSYASVPDTWRSFCRVGDLSDFRPHYRYRMGSFGDLDTVTENGEFKYGTLRDAERESITAATKGKLLNISRQMIVNDDMGSFMDLTRIMGRGAGRTLEKDVYALIAANPTMGDGVVLFHATHANIATTAAAPTVASFDAARVQMAQQQDVGANDYIDLRPAVWLGPVSLGGSVRVVNEAQYDVDVSNKFQVPNKSRGLVSAVIDTPRLSGTAWYMFCNPADEPVLEVGFLNGQQSPYTEMKVGFEVDGITWKVRLDYGVAAVGWRGVIKNAGA